VTRTTRRWIERGLLVSGVALAAYMITRFPLSDIWKACRALGWGVLVTPFLCIGWYSASSRALQLLLGEKVPWRVLLWNRLVGEGYNALVPAAGMGGEPVKLAQLSRYVDTQHAVVALINDRLIENTIALLFSAAFVAAGALRLEVTAALRTTMLTYGAIAGAAGIAMAFVIFSNVTGRVGGKIAKWLGASSIADHRLPKWQVARAFGWTFVARCLGLVEIALLFTLLGVTVTPWTVIFTGAAVAAAGFVGGVIPQGVGITEAASVGIFDLLHFPGPAGIAFALARRGRMLLMSVLGVALHVVLGRRVAGAPQLEHQQCPQALAMVDPPVVVLAQHPFDGGALQQPKTGERLSSE
jgi:hypothetical protein